MPSPDTIQYDEVEAAISLAGLELSAAELHGLICGAVCNQMKTGSAPELNRLISAGVDVRPGSLQQLQKTLIS